ncbi:50S ribosomal protein L7Ae [Nanobdella aerobiophila]|uniref:50S ribosomal protein L7Ae n=2 Tax=Nanobdella aerobiophila TaxID=2586965 RepID=A0A915WSB5_9ARCH|nr:50S ribosomal protein L7Ae [Nanobdella aerobiophila]BBL45761.1 50S ribosomal protein L7Ae [Nanobdella aerobiophila]
MTAPYVKWSEDVLNTFIQNYEAKVYEAFEKAKSTGKLKKGTNEVTKAVDRGQAKLVAIALDVDPADIVMHLPELSEEKGVRYVYVSSKEKLGQACGLHTQAAAAAIVEPGESKQLLDELIKALDTLLKK